MAGENTKMYISQGGDQFRGLSGSSFTLDSGCVATIYSQTVTINSATKTNNGIGASTAAAGSTSADAGALPAGTAAVYPCTAADDTKGVKLDTADNVTGRTLFIGNKVSNKILKIYPPTGGTINGASANAAYSSGSGKGVIIVCEDSTANTGAGAFLAFG